eukprot:402801_1
MGNQTTQPAPEQSKKDKQQTIPEKSRDDLLNALNTSTIELKELENVRERVMKQDVRNPLIVCVSTKEDTKSMREEKSNPDYFVVVDGQSHRDIKRQITQIINKYLICDNPQYDAIIILLQTICFVAGSGNTEPQEKPSPIKFFYDRDEVPRHVEKLKKDIVYRLDDAAVLLNCSQTIQFTVGSNSNLTTRPSPQMEHSSPNGDIVIWKAFEKPIKAMPVVAPVADEPITSAIKDTAEKPDTTDCKEEEQIG